MAVYLVLYWIVFILAAFFYVLGGKKEKYRNFASFLAVLIIFFLVFALATDDPIESIENSVPTFYQFLFTSLSGAFAIWKFYLNPLKERAIKVENKVSSLEAGVRAGFNSVKDEFSSIRREFNSEFNSIKEDLKLIKGNLMKR